MRRLRPIDQLLSDMWRLAVRQWPVLLMSQGLMIALTICFVFATVGPFIVVFFDHIKELTVVMPKHPSFPVATRLMVPTFALIFSLIIPVVLAGQLFKMWAQVAATLGLGHGTQRRANPWDTGLEATNRAVTLFLLSFVSSFIAGGASLLFFFPGIVTALGLSQAPFICVLERLPLMESLRHSWVRTRGYKWVLLGRYLFVTIFVFALLMVNAVLQAFPVVGLAALPLGLAVQIAVPVIYITAGYLMYLDLRPREGERLDPDTAPSGWFAFTIGLCVIAFMAVIAGLVVLYYRLPVQVTA